MPAALRWFAALALTLGLASLLLLGQQTGKKYALLVGVNQYDHPHLSRLRYAVNDATRLGEVFRQHGFQVTLLTETEGERAPTRANICRVLDELSEVFRKGDTLIIALAGHGLQFDGEKDAYFCPRDAKPFDDERSKKTLLSIQSVYQRLERTYAGTKVVLIDACRNDPRASRGRSGLNAGTSPPPPEGVAVLFSCGARQVSFEHEDLQHGMFFYHVLQGLQGGAKSPSGEVTITRLAEYVNRRVRGDVARLIDREAVQTPNLKADITDIPVLLTLAAGGAAGTQSNLIAEVGKPWKNSIGMEFMYIPPGKFMMGSLKNEEGRYDDEDEHQVEITREFWMGKHEVTRGQFRKFVEAERYQTEGEKDGKGGYGLDPDTGKVEQKLEYTWKNAGFAQQDDHPVVNVSWNDAVAFCEWLSAKEGKKYVLPTEAQWEYSCRAKSTTRFHNGERDADLQKAGNIADASLKAKLTNPFGWEQAWDDGYPFTAPVGKFQANAFGLQDMHGNVWEWCQDWYDEKSYQNSLRQNPVNTRAGANRVIRGGSWLLGPRGSRSAYRDGFAPSDRGGSLGFRVVLLR